VADDIILTNVIGFDVKAWDPLANGGAGAYVDLGGTTPVAAVTFADANRQAKSGLTTALLASTPPGPPTMNMWGRPV